MLSEIYGGVAGHLIAGYPEEPLLITHPYFLEYLSFAASY
jgi:hypothetical protein